MNHYRYRLERDVAPLTGKGAVLFVMLNPSTADETKDDATIRRCIGFAQSWGYRRLLVGNLFAARATKPESLRTMDDPIGLGNDDALCGLFRGADLIICAWGAHPMAGARADSFLRAYVVSTCPLYCLGVTRDGFPRHPLYVPSGAQLILFRGATA